MSGFRKFLFQGNLIDIAVAFIIASAFGAVVTTFVAWLTDQMPDSTSEIFSNDPKTFGAFLNATISFVILAAIVYFLIVTPYTKAKERFFPDAPEAEAPDIVLLTQIRDSLAAR